ncbi:MAG: neuroendocrine convertase 1, partial [Thermoanaerobaculia bacterium]
MKRLMRTLVVVCTLTVVLASPLKAQRREGDSGAGTREQLSRASLQQIEELLSEKHSRSKAQQKVDSQLLFAAKARQGKTLTPHIQSLETSVETDEAGFTVVDITANIDNDFLNRLRAQGAHVLYSYPRYRSVRALVALESVETVAAMPQVIWIQPKQEAMTSRPASFDEGSASDDLPRGDFASRAARVRKQVTDALPLFVVRSNEQGNAGTGVGSRSSEGDAAHEANRARSTFGVTGAGIKIGVLSDGVTNLAASQALGDLGPVTVLAGQTGSGDEGTAMLEIVHDLAPGAQLYFATAFNGIASFADNIRALRAAGCDIIVDDVFYYAETPFQDGQTSSVISTTNGGTVIQAVNDVTTSGALYFSSAGNSGNLNDGTAGVWEGDFVNSG